MKCPECESEEVCTLKSGLIECQSCGYILNDYILNKNYEE